MMNRAEVERKTVSKVIKSLMKSHNCLKKSKDSKKKVSKKGGRGWSRIHRSCDFGERRGSGLDVTMRNKEDSGPTFGK